MTRVVLGRCTLILLSASLVVACATSRVDVRRHAVRNHRGPLSARAHVPAPAWIDHPPLIAGERFIVGESSLCLEKDDALGKAWVSALVRLGMTEFPELSQVTSRSEESLKRARYERHMTLNLAYVDWSGLREATELGSPYIDWDTGTSRYKVYRLLRWADRDIDSARAHLKQTHLYRLPSPPELVRQDEKKLVEAIRAVQALNEHLERRNRMLTKVMTSVRCGVTVGDLIGILGSPDRFNPYNRLEREYFWGPYKVERLGDDPAVAAITREEATVEGDIRRWLPCGKASTKTVQAVD